MAISWPYAKLSKSVLPYPQISKGQAEEGKRKARCADLRVGEAALPALQAGAANRAIFSFLRKAVAVVISPIWLGALPVAFFLLLALFILSSLLLVPSCFSPKCKELFDWIAFNSFKAFRTVTFLLEIIAGNDVEEDVFFREAPNRHDADLPGEGEERFFAEQNRWIDDRLQEIRIERAEGQQ